MMNRLCLAAIVLWMSVSGAVETQHSPLTPHTNWNNAGSIKAMGCSNNTAVCQDGFELLPSQKCYHFSCLTDTWDNALETCRRMGATLAYPLNAVEDTILSNYIKRKFAGTADWWLGGTDAATEGKWLWAHDNSPVVYTNWAQGEPRNYTQQNCMQDWADVGWKWDDTYCTNLNPFVCQQL